MGVEGWGVVCRVVGGGSGCGKVGEEVLARLHGHWGAVQSGSRHVAGTQEEELRFEIQARRQGLAGLTLLRSEVEIKSARLDELRAKGVQAQTSPVEVDVAPAEIGVLLGVPETLLVQ